MTDLNDFYSYELIQLLIQRLNDDNLIDPLYLEEKMQLAQNLKDLKKAIKGYKKREKEAAKNARDEAYTNLMQELSVGLQKEKEREALKNQQDTFDPFEKALKDLSDTLKEEEEREALKNQPSKPTEQ